MKGRALAWAQAEVIMSSVMAPVSMSRVIFSFAVPQQRVGSCWTRARGRGRGGGRGFGCLFHFHLRGHL